MGSDIGSPRRGPDIFLSGAAAGWSRNQRDESCLDCIHGEARTRPQAGADRSGDHRSREPGVGCTGFWMADQSPVNRRSQCDRPARLLGASLGTSVDHRRENGGNACVCPVESQKGRLADYENRAFRCGIVSVGTIPARRSGEARKSVSENGTRLGENPAPRA